MATMILAPLACVGGVTLALALSAVTAMAQPPSPTTRRALPPPPPPVTATALQPDLVAVYQPPLTIVESYSAEHPCVYHSHTHTAYVKLRRAFGAPLPSSIKAKLYRGSTVVAEWPVVAQTGPNSEPIVLGWFTWTKPHPCPDGTTSYSNVPQNPNNYRLVIDPGNQVAEASETNNSIEFYIDPSLPFVKKP